MKKMVIFLAVFIAGVSILHFIYSIWGFYNNLVSVLSLFLEFCMVVIFLAIAYQMSDNIKKNKIKN